MFEKRIQRGIKLLNREYPGWTHWVDPNALDMGSHQRCVLGQVYGTYERGRFRLGLQRNWGLWLIYPLPSVSHGFTLLGSEDDYFRVLTNEWRQAILRLPTE